MPETGWKSNRVAELDILRGIAIILVVADHCSISLPTVPDYFEVPAFFVISGYLFSTGKSLTDFVKKKFLRLIVPYFFYSVLFIILSLPLSYVSELTPKRIIMDILLPSNYPLWFLKALFWSMIFAYPVYALKLMSSLKRALLTLFASASISIIISLHSLPAAAIISGIPQAIQALPLIIFGSTLSMFRKPEIPHYKYAAGGTILLILCVLVWHGHTYMHICDLGNPYVFYPYSMIVFIGFAAIISTVSEIWWIERFLGGTGKASLFIFCTHAIFIEYVSVFTDNTIFTFIVVGAILAITVWLVQKSELLRKYHLY